MEIPAQSGSCHIWTDLLSCFCRVDWPLSFLRNPKFRLRPIIELLQHHIEPLKSTVEWGPLVPYNITGQINLHPRAAMQFRAGPNKDDFVKSFDQVASDA